MCGVICVYVVCDVCVCVYSYTFNMHISGDGDVVLVDLEQEPHRVQDWSELPVVRYTSVCCSIM